jgi:hypothetical protein
MGMLFIFIRKCCSAADPSVPALLCRAAALDRLNINAVPIGGGSRTLAAALAPLRRLAEVVTELTLGVNDGVADPLAVAIIAPMHGPVVKQSLVELLSRWALLANRGAHAGKAERAFNLLACPAVVLVLLGLGLGLGLLPSSAPHLLLPAACRYADWTTQQAQAAGQSCVAVLYASAYGNTAGLAQAISRGITKAGGAHTCSAVHFGCGSGCTCMQQAK